MNEKPQPDRAEVVTRKTNFQRVAEMNVAFGNPQGRPQHLVPNHKRIVRQASNILHEYVELLKSLQVGTEEERAELVKLNDQLVMSHVNSGAIPEIDLEQTRDSLCDIHVFAYGVHHYMGIDADRDMSAVLNALFTRFIKNDADKEATVAKHAKKGVTEVYFQGEYPVMVMKSAVDQPDAPKDKFMKSASYSEPVFYTVDAEAREV